MRRKLGRLLLALTALALPALLAREARACECGFDGRPCHEYWEADAVFVGAVVGESRLDEMAGSSNQSRRLVRLSVEQPLRGVESAEVEVATGLGGGDCGYHFRAGERYVVYAYRGERDGRLQTSICTRTRPLAEAEEDLAFVRGLAAAEPAATVSGRVYRRDNGRKEGGPDFKPVAGAEVAVEGAGARRELKTDEGGGFGVGGLAAGKYRVSLKVPRGLVSTAGDYETGTVGGEFEVAARGCAQKDFYLESDTRVAGRVFDYLGRPAANLPLQMRGAPSDLRNVNHFLSEKTDAEGRFEFKAVRPGEYVLGVRIYGPSGEPVPYARTYFPGTPSQDAAGVVKVAEGEHVAGLEMRLPPPLAEYEVAGSVVWEDGRPAPGAYVYLAARDESGATETQTVQTDAGGRFTLKVYEGRSYKASAYPQGATGPAAQGAQADVPSAPGAKPVRLVLPALKN